MLKLKLFAIVLAVMTLGLTSCAQSEQNPAEVESNQETKIEGPAFVLFFTDP